MKADEFDQAFDRGEDVSSALNLPAAQRPGLKVSAEAGNAEPRD
jgi:hypothetical protein